MTTALFIDKEISKTMKTFMRNVFLNAENKISDVSQFLILFDQTIKTRCHTIRLILSPLLVTNQSAQAVNGCHQILSFVMS
jgi:hypothetical protein